MKISIVFGLCSLISTVVFADYCGNFPERGFGGSNDLANKGIYRNYEYGFNVSIPHGLVGYSAPLPLPDHGVGILLSWEPRSYIYVGADHNSFDYGALGDAKRDRLTWITDASATLISVQDLPPILEKIKSVRFVVRHTCPDLNGIYVDDYILAFRSDKSVLYTVSLLTTEDSYSPDKLIFEKIARSLKMDETK